MRVFPVMDEHLSRGIPQTDALFCDGLAWWKNKETIHNTALRQKGFYYIETEHKRED